MKERVRFGRYIRFALSFGDYAVLNLVFLSIYFLVGKDAPFVSKWVWLIANIAFVPSVAFFSGIHNHRIVYADRVVINALQSSLLFVGVFLALLYVFDIYDIGALVVFVFGFMLFFLLSVWWLISRRVLKRFRRMGLNFKRVIIIGAGPTGRMVAQELASDAGYGYRMMGVFDDDESVLGNIQGEFTAPLCEVADFVRLNKIDMIFYTVSAENEETIRRMMMVADEAGVEFVYVPKFHRVLRGQFHISSVGALPAMTHTLSPLHSLPNRIVKRLLDLCVAVPFCILSPIVFIPIAVVIKLTSPGPVFFRQKRTGIYGHEFDCFKFAGQHSSGYGRRSQKDQVWRFSSSLVARRTSAVLQCVDWRYVCCGSASTYDQPYGRIQCFDRQVYGAACCQAGHYGLGAGERLSWCH